MNCSQTGDNPFSESATNYHLNRWPAPLIPYGLHKPQWVKATFNGSWCVLYSRARFHPKTKLVWTDQSTNVPTYPRNRLDIIIYMVRPNKLSLVEESQSRNCRSRTIDPNHHCTRFCLNSMFIDLFITTHTFEGTEVHSTNIWKRTFQWRYHLELKYHIYIPISRLCFARCIL